MRVARQTSIYFSDVFNVSPGLLEEYGAFDVSLVNDLPRFIDPFLLFNDAVRRSLRRPSRAHAPAATIVDTIV